MIRHRYMLAAAIIAAIILIGFVIFTPHTRDLPSAASIAAAGEASVPAVTLSDAYRKGVHTLSGSLVAPTACTEASAQAATTTDATGAAEIAVAITMPQDSGVCLELPTTLTFSASVAAPAGLPIVVTVNGALATTTAP
jgi:hypothetical protein